MRRGFIRDWYVSGGGDFVVTVLPCSCELSLLPSLES